MGFPKYANLWTRLRLWGFWLCKFTFDLIDLSLRLSRPHTYAQICWQVFPGTSTCGHDWWTVLCKAFLHPLTFQLCSPCLVDSSHVLTCPFAFSWLLELIFYCFWCRFCHFFRLLSGFWSSGPITVPGLTSCFPPPFLDDVHSWALCAWVSAALCVYAEVPYQCSEGNAW